MLALSTLILSAAATAVGNVIQRDVVVDDSLSANNDTGNWTAPERGDYIWKPTCKLPHPDNYRMSEGFDFPKGCVSGTGTLQAYMMFVDFPDAEDDSSPQILHDNMVYETVQWFDQASYGTLSLNVTADTSKYHRMPKTAASYDWMGSNYRLNDYIQDALDAFMANGTRAPPPEVDALYIVPTGRAAKFISRSITEYEVIPTRQGVKVAQKTIAFGAAEGDLTAKVMVHETGHTFCLPDYYPMGGGYLGMYVGGFSVMAQDKGIAPDYFAWDKYRVGWLKEDQVDCILEAGSTEHTLTPLAYPGGKKAVVVARSETTALIAEVRIVGGVDNRACAPGVLLTKIDTRETQGPIKVIDATPGSMGCVGMMDDLVDAPLALTLKGSNSLAAAPVSKLDVPEFNVTVTLLSQKYSDFTIRVDRRSGPIVDAW